MDTPRRPPAPRPRTIVYFERINLGVLALGMVNSWLNWDEVIARLEAAGTRNPASLTIWTMGFSFVLTAGLTLLISRRRSRIAKWVSIGMFALGVPMVLLNLANGVAVGSPVIHVLFMLIQTFAFGLLFSPSARGWINPKPEISAEIFR